MKRLCAKAALNLVPDHGIIGLGGGETISYLAEDIKEARKGVKVVTPSDHTAQVCKKLGLEIVDTKEVKEIEIAFDGCDQVDSDLDAYKSGGGIHTLEKIIAKIKEVSDDDFDDDFDDESFDDDSFDDDEIFPEPSKDDRDYVSINITDTDDDPSVAEEETQETETPSEESDEKE